MVVAVVSEDLHQGVVVAIVVTTLDVSCDAPLGASPGLVYFGSGRLAPPVRSASV